MASDSALMQKYLLYWGYVLHLDLEFRGKEWFRGKESTCQAENASSFPGSGRPPGKGNGNPLQCYCLGNPMDRGVWPTAVHGVTKSELRLSN